VIRFYAISLLLPAILLGVSIGFALKNDIQNSSLILMTTCIIGIIVNVIGGRPFQKIMKSLDKS
jgi:hypothetical protein